MFEVTLANGKTVKVGGMLICSDEKLKEVAPDLFDALAVDPKEANEYEEQCYQITKFYNKGLEKRDFLIDSYSMNKIFSIWNGTYQDKKKD